MKESPKKNCISLTLVYIRAEPSTAALFNEYADLIQPLANIDTIQMLKEDPSATENTYTNIATTSDYTFYFRSNWAFILSLLLFV